MQNRRYFLKTGISVAAAGVAGASALMGARRSLATEAPPETTSLRLGQYSVTCTAPLDIVDDLLREEGFADVRYEHVAESLAENITRGEVDFGLELSPPIITAIDAGWPVVMLAGVHLGCEEMFAHESIRSVVDLKGKKFGVLSTHITTASYVVPRIIVASVGLDPAKDINWVALAIAIG
jgi:NitT/TauT family transport system substrate-binding protein